MQSTNMNHSKSILDQVDEYLHDNDPNTHATFMESEKDVMNNTQLYTGNWLSDDIQLDLDHLGETFFNNHNNNTHGNNTSHHDTQSHPLENRHHNDQGINGGHINHQQFNLLDQANCSLPKNAESNMLNKNSNFASIQSDLVFSPSASPLVAAGRSNMGLQVTPFMNPQVLMGSNSTNVSNINTPYLRESGVPNADGETSTHTSTKPTPLISHYSPLSSPAVNDSQMYSSTNFTLPDSAVEPMQNNNSNNHHSSGKSSNASNGRNNSNNSTKLPKAKKSSTSSRGKRISFSSSTSTSGKQNFNGSTSKVRKNSPYMSANRPRRNYQELKNKNGSTIANSDSSGNTPVGNNNSTTPTNASWDDMVFKLPESSTAVVPSSNNVNNNNNGDALDSGGSKESSLTLSHFAVANKILPGTFENNELTNGFDEDNKMTNKMVGIPLQTSIETTESWKQRTNNAERTRSSNSLSSSGTPPKYTKNGSVIINTSPAIKPRKASKVLSENGSSTNLTKVKSRSESKSGKKDDSKKEVHKVAEQERRNRLNSALNDLSGLIPDDLKETISIPSKATTAELACIYIRSLQDQIHKLEQSKGVTHH